MSLTVHLRFASHWKHQNRSYRTLTKAFGLRFIISVSRTCVIVLLTYWFEPNEVLFPVMCDAYLMCSEWWIRFLQRSGHRSMLINRRATHAGAKRFSRVSSTFLWQVRGLNELSIDRCHTRVHSWETFHVDSRRLLQVSGHAGRFDVITLTLNIGSLIGILGLATFICDIVALYVHRQSDVYRQQKFQDVDLNLLRLETLNTLPMSMMSEESKRNHANHVEEAILTGHVIENTDATSIIDDSHKRKFAREKGNHHDLYDTTSNTSKDMNHPSTPMLIYGNYHQQRLGLTNSISDSPEHLIKQRRPTTARPSQLTLASDEKNHFYDKANIVFVDEDSPEVNLCVALTEDKSSEKHSPSVNPRSTRLPPKIETFLWTPSSSLMPVERLTMRMKTIFKWIWCFSFARTFFFFVIV